MLLGGHPLGVTVSGQISPPSFYVLSVTVGSYQLTGVTQPALVVALPAAMATFALTGKDAPLGPAVVGQSGPYALTGISATFRGTLPIDELALNKAIERAARAEALQRDELLTEALEALDHDYVKAWRATHARDTDARER